MTCNFYCKFIAQINMFMFMFMLLLKNFLGHIKGLVLYSYIKEKVLNSNIPVQT